MNVSIPQRQRCSSAYWIMGSLCMFLTLAYLLVQQRLYAGEEPEGEIRDRLVSREIVLVATQSNRSGGEARVQALIQASAQSVWDRILSCDAAFIFVEGLKTCEELENTGDRAVVHQVVKKAWWIPKQDFVFESYRRPYHEISFALLKGNLKAMSGSWKFTRLPEGLLLDYEIRVQPALPVPGFIVSRVMRKGMPDLIACIRGLAGGSGSKEQEHADLARCRGPRAGEP